MGIEKYFHDGPGYCPFIIREGWQVAQLNHVANHGLNDILDVERHNLTDEVFVLVSGKAVLLSASFDAGQPDIEYVAMELGVTYNVPAGVWHNIAMSRDCQVMITEKDRTHVNDCEYRAFTNEQLQEIYRQIARIVDFSFI